jgi:hypothetical protein
MLQAFYWDCPKLENREPQWWTFIKSKLPTIARAAFTALWLPPANKAASWKSMGYDPYDYYNPGEFDQKGGVPTWFGSKAELLDVIQSAHAAGLSLSEAEHQDAIIVGRAVNDPVPDMRNVKLVMAELNIPISRIPQFLNLSIDEIFCIIGDETTLSDLLIGIAIRNASP